MVVEGDDDGPGTAATGLGHEVLEQVRVTEVEAIEHADDHERGARRGLDRVQAADDPHSGALGNRLGGALAGADRAGS